MHCEALVDPAGSTVSDQISYHAFRVTLTVLLYSVAAGHVCPCFALLPEGDMICFPTLRIWASLMACLGLWNAANMVVFWS